MQVMLCLSVCLAVLAVSAGEWTRGGDGDYDEYEHNMVKKNEDKPGWGDKNGQTHGGNTNDEGDDEGDDDEDGGEDAEDDDDDDDDDDNDSEDADNSKSKQTCSKNAELQMYKLLQNFIKSSKKDMINVTFKNIKKSFWRYVKEKSPENAKEVTWCSKVRYPDVHHVYKKVLKRSFYEVRTDLFKKLGAFARSFDGEVDQDKLASNKNNYLKYLKDQGYSTAQRRTHARAFRYATKKNYIKSTIANTFRRAARSRHEVNVKLIKTLVTTYINQSNINFPKSNAEDQAREWTRLLAFARENDPESYKAAKKVVYDKSIKHIIKRAAKKIAIKGYTKVESTFSDKFKKFANEHPHQLLRYDLESERPAFLKYLRAQGMQKESVQLYNQAYIHATVNYTLATHLIKQIADIYKKREKEGQKRVPTIYKMYLNQSMENHATLNRWQWHTKIHPKFTAYARAHLGKADIRLAEGSSKEPYNALQFAKDTYKTTGKKLYRKFESFLTQYKGELPLVRSEKYLHRHLEPMRASFIEYVNRTCADKTAWMALNQALIYALRDMRKLNRQALKLFKILRDVNKQRQHNVTELVREFFAKFKGHVFYNVERRLEKHFTAYLHEHHRDAVKMYVKPFSMMDDKTKQQLITKYKKDHADAFSEYADKKTAAQTLLQQSLQSFHRYRPSWNRYELTDTDLHDYVDYVVEILGDTTARSYQKKLTKYNFIKTNYADYLQQRKAADEFLFTTDVYFCMLQHPNGSQLTSMSHFEPMFTKCLTKKYTREELRTHTRLSSWFLEQEHIDKVLTKAGQDVTSIKKNKKKAQRDVSNKFYQFLQTQRHSYRMPSKEFRDYQSGFLEYMRTAHVHWRGETYVAMFMNMTTVPAQGKYLQAKVDGHWKGLSTNIGSKTTGLIKLYFKQYNGSLESRNVDEYKGKMVKYLEEHAEELGSCRHDLGNYVTHFKYNIEHLDSLLIESLIPLPVLKDDDLDGMLKIVREIRQLLRKAESLTANQRQALSSHLGHLREVRYADVERYPKAHLWNCYSLMKTKKRRTEKTHQGRREKKTDVIANKNDTLSNANTSDMIRKERNNREERTNKIIPKTTSNKERKRKRKWGSTNRRNQKKAKVAHEVEKVVQAVIPD